MKPSIPKGTRDFGPQQVKRRQFIINTIRNVYEQFGYQPIETPVMENLSTLTGKYGEEGDKLLFRILNQGDYLKKANQAAFEAGDSKKFTPSIASRGLRYDLTIPFARYVVMNRNDLAFPFKRYQIQAVWRGDRPQKGRYREFYQCDADSVGSTSLLNEVELTQIFDQVFAELKVNVTIRLNNRKILAGIAEVAGQTERLTDLTIAIDKLDKVGVAGVEQELMRRGIAEESLGKIKQFLSITGDTTAKLTVLKELFANSTIGLKGVIELETVFSYLKKLSLKNPIVLDLTLARGLDYYTGTIYEVVANDVKIGSIGGGGRYDDLTSTFGLKNVSGVGISFGLDRIYDVMLELNLFEQLADSTTKVLLVNFGGESEQLAFEYLQRFRAAKIPAEIFPDATKLKKQMKYAHVKRIPFVLFVQPNKGGAVEVKNMETGEQQWVSLNKLVADFKKY